MSEDTDGPDTRRAVLALLCVFGLVAASAAAPALANQAPLGGLDSPRAPSEVPDFLRNADALNWLFGQQSDTPIPGGTNTFGALDLGDATSVGGPISESQRQQAASPHFVGTASGRTYWRTGAFIEYTGVGWEEQGDESSFDQYAGVPDTETTTHYVELKRPASALPLVWRPASFQPDCGSGNGVCDIGYFQSETGGLSSSTPLGEGAAYRVESQEVPRSEQVLESSSDADVPIENASTEFRGQSSVDRRYESVSTTSRVRALASRVVGDAETKYDAVRAVERYLESEKTYSLSDVPQPNENVADQFLFEQDKGYCEHFASSMAVLLRTQDIPARYVVGYAGGERVGDDRYLLRGADAHAWVEVYFENVGWVRFDPTPSAPRQAADERLRGASAYSINLNQTATPGERVTATVTAAGTPTPGVAVSVNGERVGVTDERGEVVFTVPYDEELNVSVRPSVDAEVAEASAGLGGEFAASVPPPAFAQDENDDGNTTERSFPVDADVSFRFDGDVEPGTTVTMQAFVGGNEFPNAEIEVAGERVGRTDENGRIEVRIPEDASGVIELTASRDELSRTETYPVDGLTVSTSASLLAPMPWTEASARVTSGGEPVSDAVVEVNGERVGRTDERGEVSFEIPVARAPAVTALSNEKSAVTYVDGVLPTLVVVALAALGALGAAVVAARRSGITVEGVVSAVTRAANELAALAVRGVVGAADALADLASEFRTATRDGWRGVLAWFRSLPGRFTVPNVSALFAAVVAALRGEDAAAERRASVARGSRNGSRDGSGARLQTVWRRFVGLVGVERWETKTPAEVARRAVRSGFPERPVYALTSAFRDAAYGERSEGENAEQAQRALDELDEGDEQ